MGDLVRSSRITALRRSSLFLLTVGAVAIVTTTAVHAVPSAPTGLSGSATAAGTVTLSWTAPAGSLLGYRLEAGSAPGLSNLANLVIGVTTTFSAPNVPPGTYYVRVRAIASDGESPPSNEAVIAVGAAGCAAAPNAPLLAGGASGSVIAITWSVVGGCPATSYTLFAGSGPGLSNIAVVNAGPLTTLASTAPPGTYYLRVVAHNAFGSSGSSNEVVLSVGAGTILQLPPLTGTVAGDSVSRFAFTAPVSGLYRATLTWSNPAIDLDLYLARPGCDFYPPTPCLLAVSDATIGTMEQVSFPVVAGQGYELWIDNFSATASAFTVQDSITSAVSAPAREMPSAAPTLRKVRPPSP